MTVHFPSDVGTSDRDMELVRALLLFFATKKGRAAVRHQDIRIEGWDANTHSFDYYCLMLYQAGFLNAEPILSANGRVIDVVPFDLTWQGHEFLAPIRDDATWRKTKAVAKELGALSVETIRSALKSALSKKIRDLTGGEFTL